MPFSPMSSFSSLFIIYLVLVRYSILANGLPEPSFKYYCLYSDPHLYLLRIVFSFLLQDCTLELISSPYENGYTRNHLLGSIVFVLFLRRKHGHPSKSSTSETLKHGIRNRNTQKCLNRISAAITPNTTFHQWQLSERFSLILEDLTFFLSFFCSKSNLICYF